jgi:iron-sulfur cluster assembly protein
MTPEAESHVQKHLDNRNKGLGIRLGVRTVGCSGLAYTLEFFDETRSEDRVYEFGNVLVAVDPKSHIYLDGTQLDYVKEGLSEGFVFKNPNVDAECGCGESFTV